MRSPRILIAAGLVLVVLVVAVVALSSIGGGDPPVRAKLTLEQFGQPGSGPTELLVSLPDARLNTPDTTGGETTVQLQCFDESGGTAISLPTQWPLLEEAGYPLPHVHHPADRPLLDSIRRCRLTGSGIDFEGSVPGPLPLATE